MPITKLLPPIRAQVEEKGVLGGAGLLRRAHLRRPVFAVALASILAVLGALPASAAVEDDNDGLWYYDNFGVAEANAAGADGSGVSVAIIDSVINPEVPYLKGADITIHEPSYCATLKDPNAAQPATSTSYMSAYHGTQMASMIVGNGVGPNGQKGPLGVAPKAHVLYYAVGYNTSEDPDLTRVVCPAMGVKEDFGIKGDSIAQSSAINQAVADGADIITFATNLTITTSAVYDAIAAAERAGVVIVAARANNTEQTEDRQIAGMNGVVTVQAMDASGAIQGASSVPDPAIDVVGPGVAINASTPDFATIGTKDGTSPATNIVGGFLADLKSKYPTATGNQLIQSLIRNTGLDDHPLEKDKSNILGYGIVSLRHLLRVDPTKYPDTNPLLSKSSAAKPSYAQVMGRSGGSSAQPTKAATPGAGGFPTALVIGGVVVLLIIVLVLVLVLGRRSRRKLPPGATTR